MRKMIDLKDLYNSFSNNNSNLSTEASETECSKIELQKVKVNFKTIPLFREKQSIIIERKLILRNHKLFQDDVINLKRGTLENRRKKVFEKLSKVKTRSLSFNGKNPLNLPTKSFLSQSIFINKTNPSKSKIEPTFKLPPIKRN